MKTLVKALIAMNIDTTHFPNSFFEVSAQEGTAAA